MNNIFLIAVVAGVMFMVMQLGRVSPSFILAAVRLEKDR